MTVVMGQTMFSWGDDPPITPRRSAWRLREPFCHPLGPASGRPSRLAPAWSAGPTPGAAHRAPRPIPH